MKPNAHDRMKDPYCGHLMAVIEKIIAQADAEATVRSRPFTDSQVRSTLIKAIRVAKGDRPAVPVGSEHERLLADLIPRILKKREDVLMQVLDEDGDDPAGDNPHLDHPVPLDHWIRALETIVASIKIRTQMEPGSRGYLNFIADFVQTMPAAVIVRK